MLFSSIRSGSAITVVANFKRIVNADAGGFRHEAPVIGTPVFIPNRGRQSNPLELPSGSQGMIIVNCRVLASNK